MVCIESPRPAQGLRHEDRPWTASICGSRRGASLGLVGPTARARPRRSTRFLGLTPYQGELKVLGRDPWTARDRLMRDVSFIADVAVLPRWMRVTQALDYVAGVHPRFDRAKAEGFLARTDIQRRSRVRELSKGMVAQLHLALVMAIDARLLVLDEPTLGLDILYRKQFYDSLLNDYFDRSRTIVVDDASGGRDPGRPHRSHVHQPRPDRARLQHGGDRVALFPGDGEPLRNVAAAQALKPIQEAPGVRPQHSALRSRRSPAARRARRGTHAQHRGPVRGG